MISKLLLGLLMTAVLLFSTRSGMTQETAAADSSLQKAVDALGDPSFQQRQRAIAELREAGMKAETTLQDNLRHPSLEVRLRVAELLSEIRLNDLQQRIEALINFRADGKELELPGWEKYVSLVGDDKTTRELFAEMLQEEFSLMQLSDETDTEQLDAKLTEAVRNQNLNNQQTIELGTYASYVFLSCLVDAPNSNIVSYIYSASHRQPVNNELRQGVYTSPLHKLLETFMEDVDQRYVSLVLNLAVEFNLKAGVKFAVSYLETAASQSDYQTRVAIMCLAKFGDESHLEILEQQFGDEREVRVYLNGKQRDSQIKDFALVACLFITEQPLQNYKLITYPDVDRENISSSLNAGFVDDEDREPAFKQWEAFRKVQRRDEAQAGDGDGEQAPAGPDAPQDEATPPGDDK